MIVRTAEAHVNKKVLVQDAPTRTGERWVATTTVRIHATVFYAVSVIDGTGQVTAEPTLTCTREQAEAHADKLVQAHPKPKDRYHAIAPNGQRKPDKPKPDKPKPGKRTPARPRKQPNGDWLVIMVRNRKQYRERFATEQEANAFIERIQDNEAG